jgi:hypothetical protein
MKTYEKISFRLIKTVSLKTITMFIALQGMFFAQQALGQLSDDFSDGDFISNPIWSGSSAFIINSEHQLQTSNTVAATAYLSTPFLISFAGTVEWEFYVKQSFSGSGSNFSRVYLVSDQQNLTTPLNGYYLQFGEAGTNDAVTLFRQSGTTSTSICRATNGGIATAFTIRVKVSRTSAGLWEIFVDNTGGTSFVWQAQGTDNIHTSSAYFGLRCTYTLSNAAKFFYDDFAITIHPAPDVTPPTLLSAHPVSSTVLAVEFSENVDPTFAEEELNYAVEGINPSTATLQSNQHTASLTFAQPFTNGVAVMLSVKGVKDVAGNEMASTNQDFLYFQSVDAMKKDILITEIFPDPAPVVDLPEAEYFEIYNRRSYPFDLGGWKISDGTTTATLSSFILLPGSYLIVTPNASRSSFLPFGQTIGVPSFPSLNNTGDVIRLIDPLGKTIDSVNYTISWYHNKEKQDGGWSLEVIDPENFCKGIDNWTASKDPAGGTPGRQNSVNESLRDSVGPKLISAQLSNKNLLTLEFDERLGALLPSVKNIMIKPPVEVLTAAFSDQSLTKLNFSLAQDLDSAQTYSITAINITDCPGNDIQDDYAKFFLKLDNSIPYVRSIRAISSTEIEIVFSERVKALSAQNILNYGLISGDVPVSSSLNNDGITVRLLFPHPLVNGIDNVINIFNVQDLAGNPMQATQKHVLFFQPVQVEYKNVIITEILADPSPPLDLPEAEFIELYNRSAEPFNLKDWTLTDGSATVKLSSLILLPYEYLILCNPARSSQFAPFGRTMGIASFPSLNNTGEALVVKDPSGLMIESVNCSDSWYKDSDKKDGGWSLELIDPENICAESENWIAAEDEHGGTPGKQNSVFANKPDIAGPALISAIPVSGSTVVLQFNEKLSKTLPSFETITLQPERGIRKISFADKSLTTLQLTLAEKLTGGVKYVLSARNVYDCAGNGIQQEFSTVTFALPEKADSLDIVINEVLFNPRPTGVDFAEVYNKSSKFINLKNWQLTNDGGVTKIISGKDLLLEPEGYIALTAEGNVLKGEYMLGTEKNFLNMTMPPFSDDEGTITLTDDQGKIIDSFSYSEKLHSKFLKDNEGVSLERISFTQPTSDQQNWKSASSTVGYATPGYLNSNAIADGLIDDQSIAVQPEIFMPLYGQPDFTEIRYDFEQGGYVANVKILDPQGRAIKHLANNELLPKEGSFRWDGDQENGSKARIGAYMVWFEIFDSSGIVKTFRKRVVIADKF